MNQSKRRLIAERARETTRGYLLEAWLVQTILRETQARVEKKRRKTYCHLPQCDEFVDFLTLTTQQMTRLPDILFAQTSQ